MTNASFIKHHIEKYFPRNYSWWESFAYCFQSCFPNDLRLFLSTPFFASFFFSCRFHFLFRKINILCMALGRLRIPKYSAFSFSIETLTEWTWTWKNCDWWKTILLYLLVYVCTAIKRTHRTKSTKSVVFGYFSYFFSFVFLFLVFVLVFGTVSELRIASIREREKQSKMKKLTSFRPWENGLSVCCLFV